MDDDGHWCRITDASGARWVKVPPRKRRGADRNGRFRDVKVGDQIEKPLKRALAGTYVIERGRTQTALERDGRNPDMPAAVRIVTHIWHDPVDDKEYIALAPIMRDGSVGKPREKHTRRGLASNGWYPARIDYLGRAQARATASNVETLRPGKRQPMPKEPGRPL